MLIRGRRTSGKAPSAKEDLFVQSKAPEQLLVDLLVRSVCPASFPGVENQHH